MSEKQIRLVRKPMVLDRTGLSNSTLYYFINEGNFPAPVKLGKRTVAWREEEIDEWIKSRECSMSHMCEGDKNEL